MMLRRVLYLLWALLFSPLLLLGYLSYQIAILRYRGKVSGTAYEPFNARLVYHHLGTRPDPVAAQLAPALPATSPRFQWLLIRPLVWASRFSGFTPVALRYPPPKPTPMSAMVAARCEFFDHALQAVAEEVKQVVILGAGWDTRAYGLLKDTTARVFEVDTAATQAVKRTALAQQGIDSSQVTFVSCDFNQQSWLEALTANGFDPKQKSFILWEGVTMYLDEQAIQSTLRSVSTLAPGSQLAFDFFNRQWLNGAIGRLGCWAVKAYYGEPFTFGFDTRPGLQHGLASYLQPHGLNLELTRAMGRGGYPPFGGLALAQVPTLNLLR